MLFRSESLIAGTPILSSSFTQADELLSDGQDSLLYEFNNNEDMKKQLLRFLGDEKMYQTFRKGALSSGEKFTYSYNRNAFLKLICGDDYEK